MRNSSSVGCCVPWLTRTHPRLYAMFQMLLLLSVVHLPFPVREKSHGCQSLAVPSACGSKFRKAPGSDIQGLDAYDVRGVSSCVSTCRLARDTQVDWGCCVHLPCLRSQSSLPQGARTVVAVPGERRSGGLSVSASCHLLSVYPSWSDSCQPETVAPVQPPLAILDRWVLRRFECSIVPVAVARLPLFCWGLPRLATSRVCHVEYETLPPWHAG